MPLAIQQSEPKHAGFKMYFQNRSVFAAEITHIKKYTNHYGCEYTICRVVNIYNVHGVEIDDHVWVKDLAGAKIGKVFISAIVGTYEGGYNLQNAKVVELWKLKTMN